MSGLSSWFFNSLHQSCQTITWESKLPKQAIKMSQKVKEEVCNYCATIGTNWNCNLFEQLKMAWLLETGSTSFEMSNLVEPLGALRVWDKTHRKKDWYTLKSMSGLVSCWRAFTNSWMTPPLSSNDFSLEHKQHNFHVSVSGRPKSLHSAQTFTYFSTNSRFLRPLADSSKV